MATKRLKESNTQTIKRSQINFAPYNPKNHTKEEIDIIVKNFKRVGYLGGIIWNSLSGNLVDGHKRVQSMDVYYKYDGSKEADYDVKVEVTEMDDKTEIEQNIFQTKSRKALDDDLLRDLIPHIDYNLAGLSDFEVELLIPEVEIEEVEIETNTWRKEDIINDDLQKVDEETSQSGENKKIDRSKNFYEDTPENQIARHNEIEKVKERIRNQNDTDEDHGALSYVVVRFDNWKNKESFMIRMGYNKDEKMIDGEEFSMNVERIG